MIEAVKAWTSMEAGAGIGGEILITPDEEIGSPCSQHLLQEAAAANDLGLVFESALPGGELVANRKGTGTFRLIASGKAAHTGRDFAAGCNAIAGLADALLAIHQLNATEPEAIFNVGKVSGGGPVNIVPDRAEAFINIRTGSTTTAERIVPLLNDIIAASERRHPGLQLTLDGTFSRPPRNESPGCQRLHALWNAAERQLGLPASGKRSTGGSSDGNVLAHHGLPHLDGVGVCGGNIHSHDEFAFAASIDAQINRTVAFLHQLSANPGWRNHSST
jgi:glutamate carboxypeptidase